MIHTIPSAFIEVETQRSTRQTFTNHKLLTPKSVIRECLSCGSLGLHFNKSWGYSTVLDSHDWKGKVIKSKWLDLTWLTMTSQIWLTLTRSNAGRSASRPSRFAQLHTSKLIKNRRAKKCSDATNVSHEMHESRLFWPLSQVNRGPRAMVGRAWSRKGTFRPDRGSGNLSRRHLAFSKIFNIRPDRCTWPILHQNPSGSLKIAPNNATLHRGYQKQAHKYTWQSSIYGR